MAARARPSSGMMRASWIIACMIVRWRRRLHDLEVVVVAAGELRRTAGDATLGEITVLQAMGRARTRRDAEARSCPAGVNAGRRPSDGSMASDVRRGEKVPPRSHQNWL